MSYGRVFLRRLLLLSLLATCISAAAVAVLILRSQTLVYTTAVLSPPELIPFPLGVDPRNATITEQIAVEEFYTSFLATNVTNTDTWLMRLAAKMQTSPFYQQLASPVSRVVVIWPGERSEQVTQNIGDVLRWSSDDRAIFASLMADNELAFSQGFIPPGQYVTHRKATPADIANQLQKEFDTAVLQRYTDDIEQTISLGDALVIASLIEREARDFENMREISGVIWNRLFIDMPLQLDASLQYVKTENPYEENWWPAVRPADKFIDSPFNTYQNKGLPPEPIANPSVEAIVAALNPRVTECLYYFHSATREYYCSQTYEEHVTKLQAVYGTGE